MASGLYIYCVAEGSRSEDLAVKGIGGERVVTLPHQGVIVVAQACEKPFEGEDVKALSELVLTHQAVIDVAWEKYETVVPFSFGMIIVPKEGRSAEENLKVWVEKEEEVLKQKLHRFKGKAEYGVQISWDPEIIAPRTTRNDPEIRKLEDEVRSRPAGTAYLLNQKLEQLIRRRLEAAADAYFKEFFHGVRGEVEDVRVEKVRKEEPPRQMLMNLSCLVTKGDTSRLGEVLDKISKIDGFSVRFTGPWPPYSFVNP